MPILHLNRDQKLELSKAFFNFGNIIGAAVIVNQAILGTLTFGTFIFGSFLDHFWIIFGSFCFIIVFTGATVLLKTERHDPTMKVTFEMVIGTFTCITSIFVLMALYGDRQHKTQSKH